ncbi:MAG: class I SAM-dependent methyltransferase [Solirubrobacteraceae bacterium]
MAYFERLWNEVPDATPEHSAPRREFMLAALAPPSRVLDVGCGAGWFTAQLAAAGFDVVGVDVAQEPLRRARERFGDLEFVFAGEGELPFASASFDGVWLGEVLEHVQDGIGLLAELARVLLPGGRLALTTPDHGRRLRLRLGLSRSAFERHFDPRSDHVRFFTAATLATLLRVSGFERIEIRRSRGELLASARVPR